MNDFSERIRAGSERSMCSELHRIRCMLCEHGFVQRVNGLYVSPMHALTK